MCGLHDGRHRDLGVAHPGQHRHAVETGHDEVEDDEIDGRRVGRTQPRQRGLAAVDRFRVVAEPAHHGFQQTSLNGIVVDDKDGGSHEPSVHALAGRLSTDRGRGG